MSRIQPARRTYLAALLAVPIVALAFVALQTGAVEAQPQTFVAHLSGDNEVPPVDTNATGQAVLQLNDAGDELSFILIVANIDNVVQAHIHCGAEGVNGPVVAFLFGPVPGGVTTNGVLSKGTVTPGDVIPRPDSPVCPGGVANFDDLVEKIQSGEAYVNVHTTANPGGEIRGQVQ